MFRYVLDHSIFSSKAQNLVGPPTRALYVGPCLSGHDFFLLVTWKRLAVATF